jgi:hypothetical protein
MQWMTVAEMTERVPLPEGYRFEVLRRSDIAEVVAFIRSWFPGISVGSASGYTQTEFLERQVSLAGESEKDVCVVLLKRDLELAALVCCERDREALTLYGSLIVVAPAHRGTQFGRTGAVLLEALARNMEFGLIYGMATLKVPHMQRALETAGWQLIGITPGYDREMVAPGVVKRVYEAMYAKVLVPDASLLRPEPHNLTARTRAFFDFVFPAETASRLARIEHASRGDEAPLPGSQRV